MMPAEWLRLREGNPERRKKYVYLHMLEGLPEKLGGFDDFFQRRRGPSAEREPRLILWDIVSDQ